MIALRTTTLDDAQAVTGVITASYEALWRGHYPDADLDRVLPLVVKANPVLLGSGRYFIAFDDGAAAGCGGWSPDQPGGGPVTPGLGHVRHFAVHPDHLRKGIARRLHEACLSQARDAGIGEMEALSSVPAVPFYESLGYRIVGETALRLPDAPALLSLRMRLSIA